MARDDTPKDFEVGYKRPPLHSRFRPGQSGNPRGRRKGLRNFATDAKEMLQTTVSLSEKGRPKLVSTQAAALYRLREKALKGGERALDQLLKLAQLVNDERSVDPAGDHDLPSEDREILDAYEAMILLRASSREGSGEPIDDSEPRDASKGGNVDE